MASQVVGFLFVAAEVNNECLKEIPESRCYGTHGGRCPQCARYAPDAASIQKGIDDVMVLLQSLTNGI